LEDDETRTLLGAAPAASWRWRGPRAAAR